MRDFGAIAVKQAGRGGTWDVVPHRYRARARRAEMGANETIGNGKAEAVATETGLRRSSQPQEDTAAPREDKGNVTLNFLGDAPHGEQEGWFKYCTHGGHTVKV